VNPQLSSAHERFWRGLREMWTLVERMRAHPELWKRYQRIVVAQILATLVAGGVVFWVGKHGSEAWRDAFGPDEPSPARTASAAAPAPATAARPPAPPAPSGKRPVDSATPPATGTSPDPKQLAVQRPPGEEVDRKEGDPDEDKAAEPEEGSAGADSWRSAARLSALAIGRATREAAREARKARGGAARSDKKEDPESERRQELEEEAEELRIQVKALALGAHQLAQDPPKWTEARAVRRSLERQLHDLEEHASRLEAKGRPGLSPADRSRLETIRADLGTARIHERGWAGRFGSLLALLAAIYASLSIGQIAVLAVSRDFHDALSRELSLLVNVAPEDPPLRPRIHLDLPWVRRKANRRMQFFLAFLPGTLLISALCWFLPMRRTLVSILTAVWAAYWWMVMTAGQSARAWSPPETTPPPWYLRGWNALVDKLFLLHWGVPRAWGRLWHRFSRRFYGPSERVEEQPLEFAGLALARTLALVPLVKLAVRPLFSVAAAHLLVEHAAAARLPVAVTPRELELAVARAPDPEARTHSGVAG
jgi:hypothetical protein